MILSHQRYWMIALLFLTGSSLVTAALPPYWQRAAEIKAIFESNEVARALKDKPVDRVERISEDSYQLQSGACKLEVRIIGEKQNMPGPRKFTMRVGKPECK